jgi:phage tail-like protein
MSVNGLRFWMLADEGDWRLLDGAQGEPGAPSGAYYDPERNSLHLASSSERTFSLAPAALALAKSRLEDVPQARDAFGTRAFWDPGSAQVMATGALPGALPIFTPPAGERVVDLAMGYDGVLYMTTSQGALLLLDRRERWRPLRLAMAGFSAWRLAAIPQEEHAPGGMWVLDRVNRKIARLEGQPLPNRPYTTYTPGTFRLCEENPNPPRLLVMEDPFCGPMEEPAAIACGPDGRAALLTWDAGSGESLLRLVELGGQVGVPHPLHGAPRATSLAWVSAGAVAVMVPNMATLEPRPEAPVYPITAGSARSTPLGDLYPLPHHSGGPFLHGLDLPPHYPTSAGSIALHHLSLPAYAPLGTAVNCQPMDSGSPQTVWDRLYLEADIPANCRVTVYLAAGDTPYPNQVGELDWHPHIFGQLAVPEPGIPQGVWIDKASEIPRHPGLLACPRESGRSGLFTVLIQRSNRRVRALQGRYLHVRVRLEGTLGVSPEIAALRAYGSRFSYRDQYLPRLYRETLFGADADEIVDPARPGNTTPADFLERFLGNFEGVLTEMENNVAGAYLVTEPRTAPDEALEWLGSWIGMSFTPYLSPARRRRMLENAAVLFQRRGTLDGLRLALEIATDGGVSGGEIIILEDFRLRRTFATILGADLADETDPLVGAVSVSGNSFVGDTLFLGDENNREFLALFSDRLVKSKTEERAIAALYDGLAHRLTVLVHQEVEPQDLGLISKVVELETPAHVLAKVLTASKGFMVGFQALVGVDSYLGLKDKPLPVRVEESFLGVRDLLRHLPSLDPRLEAGRSARPAGMYRPIADLGGPQAVDYGHAFILDASQSVPAPGRRITLYVWTLLE